MSDAEARSPIWSTAAAVGVSVALLAWALRDVEFHALVGHVRGIHLVPMLGAAAIGTLLFPLKIFRWRLLLRRPNGDQLPPVAMWHAIAMGFMANNVLPFRIGEVVRIFAVSRLGRVGWGAALSSIAVERIFDVLALVFLLVVSLFAADIPADLTLGGVSLTRAASLAGALGVAALAAAIAVVVFPRPAERLIERVVPSAGLAARLVGVVEDLRNGMQALRSPGRIAGVVLWSVALWLLNGLALYVAFFAFDIPVGIAGALLLLGVLSLGIAVPSAPGFVGVFEAAIVLVLGGLYGVSDGVAVAYALTYHVVTFVPITLLGLWSVARTGLGLRGLRREATSRSREGPPLSLPPDEVPNR